MNPDLQLTPGQIDSVLACIDDRWEEPGPDRHEVEGLRGGIDALMGALAKLRGEDPSKPAADVETEDKPADAPRKGVPRSRFKHPHQLIFG